MTEMIAIEIVYAEPDRVWRQELQLPAGASVQQALSAMDPGLFPPNLKVLPEFLAVYGRMVRVNEPLHANDRIELLRPLIRDPKDTRRLRAADNPVKKSKR
jgi:putative ubiquitin-RnfH superfamily antitoxin RatB of RatAB toxin-antitoxin module